MLHLHAPLPRSRRLQQPEKRARHYRLFIFISIAIILTHEVRSRRRLRGDRPVFVGGHVTCRGCQGVGRERANERRGGGWLHARPVLEITWSDERHN